MQRIIKNLRYTPIIRRCYSVYPDLELSVKSCYYTNSIINSKRKELNIIDIENEKTVHRNLSYAEILQHELQT